MYKKCILGVGGGGWMWCACCVTKVYFRCSWLGEWCGGCGSVQKVYFRCGSWWVDVVVYKNCILGVGGGGCGVSVVYKKCILGVGGWEGGVVDVVVYKKCILGVGDGGLMW